MTRAPGFRANYRSIFCIINLANTSGAGAALYKIRADTADTAETMDAPIAQPDIRNDSRTDCAAGGQTNRL
jgi:hypothetical protein